MPPAESELRRLLDRDRHALKRALWRQRYEEVQVPSPRRHLLAKLLFWQPQKQPSKRGETELAGASRPVNAAVHPLPLRPGSPGLAQELQPCIQGTAAAFKRGWTHRRVDPPLERAFPSELLKLGENSGPHQRCAILGELVRRGSRLRSEHCSDLHHAGHGLLRDDEHLPIRRQHAQTQGLLLRRQKMGTD